jgi:putative nucleotidyltransferase with HDIG domain
VVAALASAVWLVWSQPHLDGHSAVLGLTLIAATLVGVRTPLSLLGGAVTISGESIPILACILIAPSLAVPLVLLTGAFAVGTPSVKLLGMSQTLLGTIAASWLAVGIFDLPRLHPHSFLLGATSVVLSFVVVTIIQVIAYERIVWGESVRTFLPIAAGSIVATTAFALPILCLAAWAVDRLGAVALPLLMVPLALTQYFHSLFHRKLQLTDELAEKAQVLARTNLQFAAAMVKALDQRDAYTAGHSAAVAVYTRDIAREMGFDDETVRMAHLAGLLHDIGKIGVPGRVLNKTAPLDDEEYELMKSHAAMGAEILGEVDLYSDIATLVRYHHERIDGKGYPEQLAGDAIPAISRMISVADTYSAMTTDRPYREGMPTEKAMSILRDCRGTQLDQDFTDAFLRILVIADDAYRRGKQTDFEVEVAKHQALSQVEAEAVRLDAPPMPAGPIAPVIAAETPEGELIEIPLEREAA